MKKIILSFVVLLLAVFSQAQQLQPVPGYGFQWNRGRFTTSLGLPNDTFPVTGTNRLYPWLALKSNTFYYWNTSLFKWEPVAGISSGITQVIADYGLLNVDDSTLKVDSATLSLYYLRRKDSSVNGGYYPYASNPKGYITDASGLSGNDTTIFETVLDSTAQPGQRVLFSGGSNRIRSDSYFLYDSVNNKLMINHFNISAGGANTKLYVNGNSIIAGSLTASLDANNYLKFDVSNSAQLSHLATSGTFQTSATFHPGNGIYLYADRTDVTGNGGLLNLGNDVTNFELSFKGNITGLQNWNYTGDRIASLLATENPYRGILIDSAHLFIGKGPSTNSLSLRGFRMYNEALSMYFDSLTNNTSQDVIVGMINAAGNEQGRLGYITTGYGVDIASGVLKADTAELATQYDLTSVNHRYGHASGDNSMAEERATNYHGAFGKFEDSLSYYEMAFNASGGYYLRDYVLNTNRLELTPSHSRMLSQDGTSHYHIDDSQIILGLGASDSLMITNLTTTADTTYKIAVIGPNGRVKQFTYWPTGGGSVDGIDDVLAVGQAVTANRTINSATFNVAVVGNGNSNPFAVWQNSTSSTQNALFINSAGGNGLGIQIGASNTDYPISAQNVKASPNTVLNGLLLRATGTGSPDDGIGISIKFEASTTSNSRISNTIEGYWFENTDASRTSYYNFKGVDNGTDETFMQIQPGLVRINNNADTLATLGDVRAGGGGGGGYTTLSQFVGESNWQMYYSDGNGDVQDMTIGSAGQVLKSNGASAAPSFADMVDINFNSWYQVFEHIRQIDRGSFDYGSAGTGSGTTVYTVGTAIFPGWFGALELNTGTTNSGFAQMGYQRSGQLEPVLLDNSYRMNVGFKIRFEDLSDGTDTYRAMAGFMDAANAESSIVDGVWVSYTHADSSGKLVLKARSNNSTSAIASTVTIAADTDYTCEITGYNGTYDLYVNKVLVATLSSNIPTGAGRETSINASINKSAGTAARKMYVDWGAYGQRPN
jgi:hypothetical protein